MPCSDAEQEKHEVEGVEVERGERIGGRREVAPEVDDAEDDDRDREQPRVFGVLAGRARPVRRRRWLLVQIDPEIGGAARLRGWRRGEPHQAHHHPDLDGNRAQALPQEDGV